MESRCRRLDLACFIASRADSSRCEVGDPPMCADAAAMQWSADSKAHKAKPTNTAPGIVYMLAGATQRSDTDPYDTTSRPICGHSTLRPPACRPRTSRQVLTLCGLGRPTPTSTSRDVPNTVIYGCRVSISCPTTRLGPPRASSGLE